MFPIKSKSLITLRINQIIRVDPDKIKRVFINVLKNGFEAMPNVGKLTIESKEK